MQIRFGKDSSSGQRIGNIRVPETTSMGIIRLFGLNACNGRECGRCGSGDPLQQWDGSGTPLQQWDGSGTPLQQWDGNGAPLQRWDGSGTPLQQWDGSGDPLQQWDGSGDPLQQWDGNGDPWQSTKARERCLLCVKPESALSKLITFPPVEGPGSILEISRSGLRLQR